MTRTAVAIRHVEFEHLGLLAPLLEHHGFETSYLDAPADGGAWRSARDADLLVVLGGPIGVADTDAYPFLRTELELLGDRLARLDVDFDDRHVLEVADIGKPDLACHQGSLRVVQNDVISRN